MPQAFIHASRLRFLLLAALCLLLLNHPAQRPVAATDTPNVQVSGRQLLVNGAPFTVRGVGYAATPIGHDPETGSPYGDYFTPAHRPLYTRDLALIRAMGANTLRLWGWQPNADHTDFLDCAYNGGINPLYVIISFWLDPTRDLSDPATRQAIIQEFAQMVTRHHDHPAVLMWAIGNELNAPWMVGNHDALFSLLDAMALAAHQAEGENYHPVTTPLADVALLETIAARDAQVPHLDLWSVQIYRGNSFGTLFENYAAVSDKPLLISEYGIDAYDDRYDVEYEQLGLPYQARYDTALWSEIAAHPSLCIGGSLMAYRDEWWKGKHGQRDAGHPTCPDHDPNVQSACGYATGAHPDGYANEEWWGIVRAIPGGGTLPDRVQPRAVYYAMQRLWAHPVYLPGVLKP